MHNFQNNLTADSYSLIAEEYATEFAQEIAQHPYERHIIGLFSELVLSKGNTLCDLGCGPGHSSHAFAKHGLKVTGMDIALGMLTQARKFYPDITFYHGDLRNPSILNHHYSGVAAIFSIIHIPFHELKQVFNQCYHITQSGGYLLLMFQTNY